MTRPASPPALGHLFVDTALHEAVADGRITAPDAGGVERALVQPASLDLRLGREAVRIRAGFLPGAVGIEARLAELEVSRLSLEGAGAVLERGLVYLVPLEERLALEPGVRALFNPRSSTGRCDVFARVLVPGHPRFNETPPGYQGPLWLEVSPLSFPVRLARGDRLAQLRLERGDAALSEDELREEYARTPLLFDERGPIEPAAVPFDREGGIALHLGLAGREPAGWRAQAHTGVVHFAREGAHDVRDFWEPVHAAGGTHILAPGAFYLFASRERVVVPPHLAAEMEPVAVDLGEMRNNYAGFFDNGFGWRASGDHGTPAVLEVRAHDVPFLVEEGQVFFRLRWFRTGGTPARLYGEGRESRSYRDQDLTPARCFRPASGAPG